MANLLHFPLQSIAALLSFGVPFDVDVRVTDDDDPDTTHWELLRWNFRAAGLVRGRPASARSRAIARPRHRPARIATQQIGCGAGLPRLPIEREQRVRRGIVSGGMAAVWLLVIPDRRPIANE